jgi:hypothetical protein
VRATVTFRAGDLDAAFQLFDKLFRKYRERPFNGDDRVSRSMDEAMREQELRGADAIKFAEESLKKVHANAATWETEYVDEATGDRWIMDYPDSERHGGGTPRLRRLPAG